jgi:glycosyltransferase involved in cell wall biosynthesis
MASEKVKILYDARWILVENRFDGVSRYTHELARALAERDDLEITWLVYDARQLEKLPTRPYLMANNPSDAFKEFFALARTVNRAGHRLLYSPFFTVGTLGKKFHLVLTIHDMIYYRFRTPPQWLPWHVRLGWWLYHTSYWPMRWQLNHADVVATVSDTARQELLDARATKRDIVAVPNAANSGFTDEATRDHSAMNSVVYMGAFTPYKNVECLIDAVALVPDVTLRLCGKLPASRRPEIEARLAEKGITERTVLHDGVTDEEYKDILSNARCAMSASRLEGFGLPVLEAQQRGVPFACADTPIFREVAGESALFFDPNSPEEAAECIRQFADKKTSDEYVARGLANAARYTWTRSAQIAAEICKNL